jgi:hypothetical protein
MSKVTRGLSVMTFVSLIGFTVQSAVALPTTVEAENLVNCDPLNVPEKVHELGNAASGTALFPIEEQITTDQALTEEIACEDSDDPTVSNTLLFINNETGLVWDELWYVADPETDVSNYDGFVNNSLAFRIDTEGINQPLIYESMNADGVFEPGEQWQFVADDWFNINGPAWHMDSVGVGGQSLGWPPSTGSIIAVPEPTSIGLLVVGALGLLIRRKR